MSKRFSPVESGFGAEPKPYPLGIAIKDKVKVDCISKDLANMIHQAHHSYIDEPKHNAVVNHGVFLDGGIVGAISYGYLLASAEIAGYASDEYMEVSRVTIHNETPNLASCAMSKSQEKFRQEYAEANKIGLLVTYVREGYEGSMFKALRGKGWEFDGISKGHQAGNRRDREIRDYDKKRWICEL